MFDMTTYLATKDNPGGPIFIPEEFLPHNQHPPLMDAANCDDRPLTLGRATGGVISLVLLIWTGVYLFLAW